MSPLWPEGIQLHVGAEEIVLRGRDGLVRQPLTDDWAAGLSALPAVARFGGLRVSVADRHVRYLRLEWPAGLRGPERKAFVAHRFQAVFGIEPPAWTVLADRDGATLTSLAAALPTGLLDALRGFARQRRLWLRAITPAYVADFNRLQPRFGGAAIGAFARQEGRRLTLGLWQDGRWRALRSQMLTPDGSPGQCLQWLLATTMEQGPAPGGGVLFVESSQLPADLPEGWSGRALAPRLPEAPG